MSEKTKPPLLPPILRAVASLIIPGLGQALARDLRRGIAVFAAIAFSAGTTIWYGKTTWYIVLGLLWLWNVWDAYRLPRGAPVGVAALLWLLISYGIGWQVTEIDPKFFFTSGDRASSIIEPMLKPDFIEQRQVRHEGWVELQVPCSANPPPATNTVDGITITITPDCANTNEIIFITAEGLWADEPGTLRWKTPIGSQADQQPFQADSEGKLTLAYTISPMALSEAPDTTLPLMHRIVLEQRKPAQGMDISTNGKFVLQGILETLALALLATTAGAIFALPLGFLAARNLMGTNPITMAIYFVVRTLLNLFRSIESLIMGIIFVVIVGLGPFAGVLALTIHTIAALGKLYSEIIEGIDPGPIEAIRATGATWLQTVRYAVIPQIIPPFTALTIYRWDINVRTSTIIGMVGGGGIGFYLIQWIQIYDYRAVSAAFIAIALVVILMDFFSAQLRERLH